MCKTTRLGLILVAVFLLTGCGQNRAEVRMEYANQMELFETEYESANSIRVSQLIEMGHVLPDDLVLSSDVSIQSTLLYSKSQNYLYVNSSGRVTIDYGSWFDFTEVEFREEDGVLWLFEQYDGGFFTLRLEDMASSETYLDMFLYQTDLVLTENVEIEKVDENTYDVIVTKDEMKNFDFLEQVYDGFDLNNFSDFRIRYVFGEHTLEMDFYLTGVKVHQSASSIDFHVNSVVELTDNVEKTMVDPDRSCYVMNSSIEDTYFVFEANKDIKACYQEGDNVLAVHLEPGLYGFAGDFVYDMPDRVVNEQGETIYEPSGTEINELLQIDAEQIIYIIENQHSSGYSKTLRIKRMPFTIETLHDLPLDRGSITSTLERMEDYNYYFFEPSTHDKIMYVTVTESSIPVNASVRVYIASEHNGCNISACTMEAFYVPKDTPFFLSTRGNTSGSFTFEYFTVDTGELSHDINNPVDIGMYNDEAYAVSTVANGNLYISFEVTETNRYLVMNDRVTAIDYSLVMNLYDADGTLMVQRWDSFLELQPGMYTVEFLDSMGCIIFVPSLVVNSNN